MAIDGGAPLHRNGSRSSATRAGNVAVRDRRITRDADLSLPCQPRSVSALTPDEGGWRMLKIARGDGRPRDLAAGLGGARRGVLRARMEVGVGAAKTEPLGVNAVL